MNNTMTTGVKIVLGAVGACALLSLANLFWGMGNFVNKILSVCVSSLLTLMVAFFRHDTSRKYGFYVLLAFVSYAFSDILMTQFELVPYPIIFFSVANILATRGMLTFQGYTYNTFHLVIVSLALGCFYLVAADNLGSDHTLIVMYILILLVLCWQGINLFFIQRSKGAFLIFLFAACFLANNILQGIYEYVIPSEPIVFASHLMNWFAITCLAYSTTISNKKFRTRL